MWDHLTLSSGSQLVVAEPSTKVEEVEAFDAIRAAVPDHHRVATCRLRRAGTHEQEVGTEHTAPIEILARKLVVGVRRLRTEHVVPRCGEGCYRG